VKKKQIVVVLESAKVAHGFFLYNVSVTGRLSDPLESVVVWLA